jgi:hypothetical protein
MSKRRLKNITAATWPEYDALWRELVTGADDPHTLLDRWRSERDQRDELQVPIALRLDLLRQIAPEEVAGT